MTSYNMKNQEAWKKHAQKMFLFLFSSSFKDSAEEIVPSAWRYTLDPTRIF